MVDLCGELQSLVSGGKKGKGRTCAEEEDTKIKHLINGLCMYGRSPSICLVSLHTIIAVSVTTS